MGYNLPCLPSLPVLSLYLLAMVDALLFDVFGTVVDWHGSVVKELQTLFQKFGVGM